MSWKITPLSKIAGDRARQVEGGRGNGWSYAETIQIPLGSLNWLILENLHKGGFSVWGGERERILYF